MQIQDPSQRLLSPRPHLTPSGDPGDALSNIQAAEVVDGALCLVLHPSPTLYRFQADDTAAQDLPNIIAPPGGAPGRWHLFSWPTLISVDVTTTPYQVPTPVSGQRILVVVDTAAIGTQSQVVLPATPNADSEIIVKDGSGRSSVLPIHIQGNGQTIDDETEQVIDSDYAALAMQFSTQWRLI